MKIKLFLVLVILAAPIRVAADCKSDCRICAERGPHFAKNECARCEKCTR